MDNQDLEDEEKQRRKNEAVAYRNKKHTSTIFTIFATVFLIVVTFLVIAALFLLVSLFFIKVLNLNSEVVGNVFSIAIIVVFIAGMVIGFIIYKKSLRAIIKKFNLKDKLLDEIMMHYLTKEELIARENEKKHS